MKFDKLTVGMTLFDVRSTRVGNTALKTLSLYRSKVVEIDNEKRRALISWNSNPASWYSEHGIEKVFKDKEPVLVKTRYGSRRPTREELAEIRAKAKAKKTSMPPQKEAK